MSGGAAHLLALSRLLRLSLAPTLVADLAAGAALAGVRGGALAGQVALLLPVSLLLFAGGMALNARLDLEPDRRQRPERPLPAGLLPVGLATALAVGGLCGGPLLAGSLPLPPAAAWLALVLALLIGLYHWPLRQWGAPGPAALGAVRALHLGLGAAAAAGSAGLKGAAPAAALYGLYVCGAALVAAEEDRTPRPARIRTGLLLAAASLPAPLAVLGWPGMREGTGALLLVGWHLVFLVRLPAAPVALRAGYLLARMPVMIAVLALAGGASAAALVALAVYLGVRSLVRLVPPT